jgi:hypothetical protein
MRSRRTNAPTVPPTAPPIFTEDRADDGTGALVDADAAEVVGVAAAAEVVVVAAAAEVVVVAVMVVEVVVVLFEGIYLDKRFPYQLYSLSTVFPQSCPRKIFIIDNLLKTDEIYSNVSSLWKGRTIVNHRYIVGGIGERS